MQVHAFLADWQNLVKLLEGRAGSTYFTILFYVLVLMMILSLSTYLLTTTNYKYYKRKKNLRLNSARMMALFAELDPDPVIRINADGSIVETNDVTHKV